MTIPYLPLKRITAMHGDEIQQAVSDVVQSGWYLQGQAVSRFEQEYAAFIGTRHCIGVANGLDALTLILRAYVEMGLMAPGDEVLVPANTYIASILAITECGLKPVLVEPSWQTLETDADQLEQHLTPHTRALMLVHLYGRCAYTEEIGDFCRRHGLKLIEDNAQAHGAVANRPKEIPLQGPATKRNSCTPSADNSSLFTLHSSLKKTGSLGDAAGHSFYPGKNLGALGDGGAVTTDDDQLAEVVRALANYGSSRKYVFRYQGRNSRLDEVQAAVLSVKLRYLPDDNQRRKQIAAFYTDGAQPVAAVDATPAFTIPRDGGRDNVYHIFTVLSPWRQQLQRHMEKQGVQTMIHYPIPPHQQECYKALLGHLSLPVTERIHAQELSVPCHQAMTRQEATAVLEALNSFRPEAGQ